MNRRSTDQRILRTEPGELSPEEKAGLRILARLLVRAYLADRESAGTTGVPAPEKKPPDDADPL